MVSAPEVFTPTPKQSRVWEIIGAAEPGSLSIIGYGGAVGGGKTRTLAELCIDLSLEFPGNRILVARKDLKDLKTTTMEEFYRVCPRELISKRNESEHWCRIRLPEWPEGVESQVFFRELKEWQGLGSEAYGAVLLEEAGEIPEGAAKMLVTRMRWPAASKRAIVAASNPWPGWFERWFIDRDLPEDVMRTAGAQVHFISAKIADNPHLPEGYESILRSVFSGDDDWLTRMIDGSFESFEGQIYRDLGHHLMWPDEKLPPFSRLVGGLDFGGANEKAHKTAGVVAGLTTRDASCGEGRLVRFAHFEHSGGDVHEKLWSWMRGVEATQGRRVMWRADKTQSWGIGLASKAGFVINPSHGGADSVAAGIGLVKRRMKDGAGLFTRALTQVPTLDGQTLNGDAWYDRMRKYRWDEQPDETKAAKGTPLKRDDDTADADRYMHEEADGFPEQPYMMPKRSVTGQQFARTMR